ncbi:LLM class flavin-dependent oxidoreductase [Reyranella sp.]|uniref:LLM class flavin-dependent oxidoreductase n=1 Tax=Reyranella sp. TaxID=1929291 RepID=UPI003783CEA9
MSCPALRAFASGKKARKRPEGRSSPRFCAVIRSTRGVGTFRAAGLADHFFPWLEEQGHAPFAWSVLGALAQATRHLGLMTAMTCPIMRYHPAIIAQAAATMGFLSDILSRRALPRRSCEALRSPRHEASGDCRGRRPHFIDEGALSAHGSPAGRGAAP